MRSKKFRYLLCIWTVASLSVFLCGCSHQQTATKSRVPSLTTVPLEYDTLRFQYFYLEAIRQQQQEHYAAAFDLYNHCLDINPQSAEVHYALAGYYSALDKDSVAVKYFKKAAELSPTNNTYLERLAEVYINERRINDAIDAYERLYATNKDRSDVLGMLFRLYEHQKNHAMMLKTIDRLEATDGTSERLSLARMNVFEQQGRKKEALEVLKNLCKKHPYDLNYKVMTGNWLLHNGQKEGAYAEYQAVLNEEPGNMQAQMALIDYYRADGKDSIANTMQEQMLTSAQTPMDTKLTLMRQVIQENERNGGDSTQVLNLFNRILSEKQQNSDIAELCVAYMNLKEMPADTVKTALERVLSIAPDNAGARIQLLQMIWGEKDYDSVIEQAKTALEYNPEDMAFYYFLGLAYSQKDMRDEALATFRKGTSVINEQSNHDLASDFYAIMGDILHEKGLANEAYAAYDSCLQYKDDNYGCLNNYAYYLSEENRELQKAEQMSYRTVKAEPDNSTFLDTYAWILFMQGRYAEAQIYIDQAIEKDTTQSAVLLEHGGDIHACNNEIDKAVELWKKAQEKGMEKGQDDKVLIRKIKLRKYVK